MTSSFNDTSMLLIDFICSRRLCPICASELTFKATSSSKGIAIDCTGVSYDSCSVTIIISTEYFLDNSIQKHYSLTITIDSGQVIHCNNTSKFVALYDLEIYLDKYCNKCQDKHQFEQEIKLFYDRDSKDFAATKQYDLFFLRHQDYYYTFTSIFHHKEHWSSFGIETDNKPYSGLKRIPFIDINDFDFNNAPSIISKLQSIALLA